MSLTILAEAGPGMLPDIFEEAYQLALRTGCSVKFPCPGPYFVAADSVLMQEYRGMVEIHSGDSWTVYAMPPGNEGQNGLATRYQADTPGPSLFIRVPRDLLNPTLEPRPQPDPQKFSAYHWVDHTADRKAKP